LHAIVTQPPPPPAAVGPILKNETHIECSTICTYVCMYVEKGPQQGDLKQCQKLGSTS
jgi:hypothetical protein